MSLEEATSLLRKNGITPNKLLGQNFMIDSSLYPKLSIFANLGTSDVILDAGAGFGFLTCFLSNRANSVIAVEKDPKIATVLREQVRNQPNVIVIEGDVLKAIIPPFNKAVSIPPYYLSSQLITWLLDRRFDSAVLVMQKEFAERLVAPVGSKEYGWLSVITLQDARTELLDTVPRWMFYPQPEVDSVVVRLTHWNEPPFQVNDAALFRKLTKWLFTQRNKKLENAVVPFIRAELKKDKMQATEAAAKLQMKSKRVRELEASDFGVIANALNR